MRTAFGRILLVALVLFACFATAHAANSLVVVDRAQRQARSCDQFGADIVTTTYYTGQAYWLHASVNCVRRGTGRDDRMLYSVGYHY